MTIYTAVARTRISPFRVPFLVPIHRPDSISIDPSRSGIVARTLFRRSFEVTQEVFFPSSMPRINIGSLALQVCPSNFPKQITNHRASSTGDSTVRVSCRLSSDHPARSFLTSKNRSGVRRISPRSMLSILSSIPTRVTSSPSPGRRHIPQSTSDVKIRLYNGTVSVTWRAQHRRDRLVHRPRDAHTSSSTATPALNDVPLILKPAMASATLLGA